MRISYNIAFYYLEERLPYLKQIMDNIALLPYHVEVFIHTNVDTDLSKTLQNKNLVTCYHNMENTNPYYLTWKPRDFMRNQQEDFDVFIYSEDDILIPLEAIRYWLSFKDKVSKYGYELGFLRIETKGEKQYTVDLSNRKLYKIKKFDKSKFVLNNINPYCAFWIMDQSRFKWFLSKGKYDLKNISGYEIREKSAIGINGLKDKLHKGVIIPFDEYLDISCRVYHLPNNYVNQDNGLKIEFSKAVDFSLRGRLYDFYYIIRILLISLIKNVLKDFRVNY